MKGNQSKNEPFDPSKFPKVEHDGFMYRGKDDLLNMSTHYHKPLITQHPRMNSEQKWVFKFHLWTDYDELLRQIPFYNNGICELIPVDRSVALFGDIDIKTDFKKGSVDAKPDCSLVINFVHEVKKKLEAKYTTSLPDLKVVVINFSRFKPRENIDYWYHSFHIHIPNIYFPNLPTLASFMQDIPGVDQSVYAGRSNWKSLRMPLTWKWNETKTYSGGTPIKELCQNVVVNNMDKKELLQLCSITQIDPQAFLVEWECPMAKRRKTTKQTKRPNIANNVRVVWDENTYVDNNNIIRFNGPHECLTTGILHRKSSNGTAIIPWDGCAWFKCLDPDCSHVKKLSPLSRKKSVSWPCEQVSMDAEWVTDLHAKQTDISIIIAGMGMGKTLSIKTFILDLDRYDPNNSVLFITNRIAFSYTLHGIFGKMGFAHYTTRINHPFQIVNYESLHRLKRSYRYVILDEARSIFSSMSSTTNGNRMLTNFNVFQRLIQNAKWSCFLDADMAVDNCVADFIRHSNYKSKVLEYTHRKMQRNVCWVDEYRWKDELLKDLQQGRRIMVCVRSKAFQATIKEWTKDTVDNEKIKYYYGGMDDGAMRDMLQLDKMWSQYQLICFTSKITVGADCQINIDRVYVKGDRGYGPTAREVHQMVGRARNVTSNEILYCGPSHNAPFDDSLSFESSMANLKESEHNNRAYFDEHSKTLAIDWSQNVKPTALAKIKVHNQLEQTRSQKHFTHEFFQLCLLKGYQVYDERKFLPSIETPVETATMKEYVYKNTNQPFDITGLPELQARHSLSEEQKCRLDIYIEARPYWYSHGEKVSFTIHKKRHRYQRQIKTLALLLKRSDADSGYNLSPRDYGQCLNDEYYNKIEGRGPDNVTIVTRALDGMRSLAPILGLKSILDTETSFLIDDSSTKLTHQLDGICNIVECRAAKYRGKLNHVWKSVLGMKLKSKQCKRNGERVRRYQLGFIPIGSDKTTREWALMSDFWNRQRIVIKKNGQLINR